MHRGQLVLASALFGLAASAGFVLWLANRPSGTISSVEVADPTGGTTVAPPSTLSTDISAGSTSTVDSATPPTSIEPAGETQPPTITVDEDAIDLTVVRYDMATIRTELRTIAGIPVPAGVQDRPNQIVNFDATGNGNLLVVNRATGNVRIFSPSGAVDEWAIPTSDLGGSIVDAAVGPDRILYVSRSPRNADGTLSTFNMVGFELSGLDPVEVKRRDTDWNCSPAFCGEIMFAERAVGPPYGTKMAYAGTVIAPRIAPAARQPMLPRGAADACVDDVGDGSYGRFRDEVVYGGVAWEIEAVCGFNRTQGFATYQPHVDGSVVATLELAGRASAAPRSLLVWLRPDGQRSVLDVSGLDVISTAVVDGHLIGVRWVESGNIELFAFVLPE